MPLFAIIGASVSGLITARALQLRGEDVVVLEKDETIVTDRIKSITIDHQSALRKLKINPEFQLYTDQHIYQTPTGDKIKSVKLNNTIIPYQSLRIGLINALHPNSVKWGHRVINYEQKRFGYIIHCENGADIIADYIIGADGSGSTIRKQLIAREYGYQYGLWLIQGIANHPTTNHITIQDKSSISQFGIRMLNQSQSQWWFVCPLLSDYTTRSEIINYVRGRLIDWVIADYALHRTDTNTIKISDLQDTLSPPTDKILDDGVILIGGALAGHPLPILSSVFKHIRLLMTVYNTHPTKPKLAFHEYWKKTNVIINKQILSERREVLKFHNIQHTIKPTAFTDFSSDTVAIITQLNMVDVGLTHIPHWISNLTHLRKLNISDNPIIELGADSIPRLKRVVELIANNCRIKLIDNSIVELDRLTKLSVDHNQISVVKVLPLGIQHLSASQNKIKKFKVAELKELKILCLIDNRLNKINVERFTKLRVLHLSNNYLSVIIGLDKLSQLTECRVNGCSKDIVKELGIGQLKNMKELWLSSNQAQPIESYLINTDIKINRV